MSGTIIQPASAASIFNGIKVISVTNPATTAEPSIVAGSVIEVNGKIIFFPADEKGIGWSAIGASTPAYFYVTESGGFCYSATSPAWDTAKQGWNNSNQRCFGGCYCDASKLWSGKWLINDGQGLAIAYLSALTAPITDFYWGGSRKFPVNNTTSRIIQAVGGVPSAAAYSSAIQAGGVVGVPLGAKSIKAKIAVVLTSTAGGAMVLDLFFTDNNANIPSQTTGHNEVYVQDVAAAGSEVHALTPEIDIPLNLVGAFYAYTLTLTNCTATYGVVAVKYSMGD